MAIGSTTRPKYTNAFWVCNIIGWLFYIPASSWITQFHNASSFQENCLLTLIYVSFTIAALLCYRYIYNRFGYWRKPPLQNAAGIFIYALLISYFTAVLSTLVRQIIYQQNILFIYFPFPASQWGGSWVGTFKSSFFISIIWLFLYSYISHERRSAQGNISIKNSQLAFYNAAITLFIFYWLISFLVRWIWYWLPVGDYFIVKSVYLVVSIFFSLYILLIKPGDRLYKSCLIPLLPMILFLSFCGSVLTTIVTAIFTQLYVDYIRNIDFNFSDKLQNLYAGTERLFVNRSSFMSNVTEAFFWQLIISLFIMTYLYSTAWKPYIKNNQPLDVHKSLLFWAYNLSGWSLVFLYISLSQMLSLDTVSAVLSQISTLSNILIGAMFGVFLRFLMHHYKLVDSSPLVFIPRLLGISMILGVAATVTLIFVSYVVIYGFLDVSNLQYFQSYIATSNYLYLAFFLHALCFFVWSLLYIVTVTQRNNIKDELRSLQLSKSIKEAQLNALSAKLDPHFIFNALDNIRTLIKVDSDKARESLLIFSNILRSPISRSSNEKIKFINEVELVRNYVALIKIQFEERLNYFEDICADSEKLTIPPMMLQIMVENAITHGIGQLIEGGSLSLRVTVDNDQLICRISNTGSLQMGESRQGFGVGIKNIKERLQLLYGENGMFNLYELGEFVVAELILPVEYIS